MTEPIRITIPGRPIAKARPRVAMRGRTAYVYSPESTVLYEQHVGMCARKAGVKPLKGPVRMRVVFYVRGRHGDLSNMLKSIEDGLNTIAYIDDNQIKHVTAWVRMVRDPEEERAEVEIAPFSKEGVETP